MGEVPSGTVTFLFTDLEGSTRLWEQHPDAMKATLARHDQILRHAVARHDGRVVKTTGDGLHAAFAIAGDATAAAVDAQGELSAEAWSLPEPLRVRMGLHTGHAEIRDGDYYGPAVNRAARVAAAAHGGQIVMSHATEKLVCDELPVGVELLDLGEHRLRDLSRAERVFQVRAAGLQEEFPALRSVEAFPGNLPVQFTSFVGRGEDVAAVVQAIRSARLVTLTGVGGVGKTRLALQVAAELLPHFSDGVWFCELGATNDPDLLGQVLVATLGVQPRPARSLLESVCDYLAGRQALIVLDNCEHLLDAAAGIAEAMLRAAPAVTVLATSREGLAVAGEHVLPVRCLGVASGPNAEAIAACEAVRLFADRAAAARPSFVVDATNVTAVGEICRRLDGIPLAVELAAARVRSMSPDEIAGLLDERFRLLTGGRRRGVERHQTLRAAVEWSYALLDERDRSVFDRLGVFAGSFDTDAATSVAGSDDLTAWDVRDALDGLAAKSMVVLEDGADGGTRLRLHETMRQFALERLDDTGEAEECRRRHAQYYATFAEEAGPGLEGPDEVVWAARFDAELDNLRAAVAWALESETPDDGELGLRIIAVLGFQQFFRRSAGVGQWAEAALGRAEASTPGRRTAVLATAAWSAYHEGDIALMRARATEALREGLPPDTRSPGSVYSALVAAEAVSGDHEAALQTAAAGQRALDAIGADEFAHIVADAPALVAHLLAGQYEDARAFVAELLKRARALANPSALNIALLYYGWTRRLDESDDAIPALEECVTRSRAVATPDGTFVLRALALLARHRARHGERTPAIELLREAVVRAHDSGQALTLGFVVNQGVTVAADVSAWELAATLDAALSDGSLSGLTVLVHPADHTDRQAALDRTRANLDAARYTTAVANGTNMPYEKIIEYTLAKLDRLRTERNDTS